MECAVELTAGCVSTVFSAGFLLTVTLWTLGITLGVAISAIRKL